MSKFFKKEAQQPEVQKYLIGQVLPIIERDFIQGKPHLFGARARVDLKNMKVSSLKSLNQETVVIPIKGRRGLLGAFLGVSEKTGEIRFDQRGSRADGGQNHPSNEVSISVSTLFGLAQKTLTTSANLHSEGETNAEQRKREEGDLAAETRFIQKTNAVGNKMVAILSKNLG